MVPTGDCISGTSQNELHDQPRARAHGLARRRKPRWIQVPACLLQQPRHLAADDRRPPAPKRRHLRLRQLHAHRPVAASAGAASFAARTRQVRQCPPLQIHLPEPRTTPSSPSAYRSRAITSRLGARGTTSSRRQPRGPAAGASRSRSAANTVLGLHLSAVGAITPVRRNRYRTSRPSSKAGRASALREWKILSGLAVGETLRPIPPIARVAGDAAGSRRCSSDHGGDRAAAASAVGSARRDVEHRRRVGVRKRPDRDHDAVQRDVRGDASSTKRSSQNACIRSAKKSGRTCAAAGRLLLGPAPVALRRHLRQEPDAGPTAWRVDRSLGRVEVSCRCASATQAPPQPTIAADGI